MQIVSKLFGVASSRHIAMSPTQLSGTLTAVLGSIKAIPLGKKGKKASAHGSASRSARNPSSRTREWEEIPNADAVLLDELQGMFWAGVRRELVQVIRTLRAWRDPELGLEGVELDGDHDHDISGFDTFLDQVSASSRDFAVQYSR